jgi:hypothetical protein
MMDVVMGSDYMVIRSAVRERKIALRQTFG